MKLIRFRIRNYRSVNDSGWIDVSDRTALVGRNESGKTNLLLALASLNPPDGVKELSQVKDFPRDRPFNDFNKDLPVVDTEWELSGAERNALREILLGQEVERVKVGRRYHTKQWVDLGIGPATVPHEAVRERLDSLERSLNASLRAIPEGRRTGVKSAFATLRDQLQQDLQPDEWAKTAASALQKFDASLSSAGLQLSDAGQTIRKELGTAVTNAAAREKQKSAARQWIIDHLPTLFYAKDYPSLDGHQDVTAYLSRKQNGILTEADREFERLLKVAGLDAETLHQLLNKDHEARQQMANRAGAVVTKKIRELWTDRKLKVRFNLDAQHFDTFISDPTSVYDVEINLNERSLGFRWFFSFYIGFTADTQGGNKEDAVLLLDEPGLHLHAIAQQDLLSHFEADFRNQIIYTTHSPFMIPVRNISSVRTVNISADAGTTVTNDPTGDTKTLFPLQTALGYTLTQTLFVGPATLVVEGVTDYWYLTAVREYLAEPHGDPLPDDLVITPAGSAQKVPYMVSLLSSQDMNVVVLLDGENAAKRTAQEDLVRTKLIRDRDVIFVTDAFDEAGRREADIEDLLDPAVFDALVREAYSAELEGVDLTLNPHIPRVVKRYDVAFSDAGLTFNKTRPARLFLDKMGSAPGAVLSTEAAERFRKLFRLVGERREKQTARRSGPFR